MLPGAANGLLQTWDANTGRPAQDIGTSLSGPTTILVAADEPSALSASQTGNPVVINLKTGVRRWISKPAANDASGHCLHSRLMERSRCACREADRH
jgi:hypothetical protein